MRASYFVCSLLHACGHLSLMGMGSEVRAGPACQASCPCQALCGVSRAPPQLFHDVACSRAPGAPSMAAAVWAMYEHLWMVWRCMEAAQMEV